MQPEQSRKCILVVEDQPDIQMLLEYMLSKHYVIDILGSFDEAVAHVPTVAGYDLFILDINLGERRTGMDLLQQLRALPGCADVPALACTAFDDMNDRISFLEAGFEGYVQKPFKREGLLESVAAALDNRFPQASVRVTRPAWLGGTGVAEVQDLDPPSTRLSVAC